MSNGYLVAAGADVSAAHEIGDGFGLDVIDASSIDDPDTAASALANAANVGLLIGSASAGDTHYVAVLRAIAQRLQRAQLILIDANARAALPFLPEAWPAMSLEEARARSAELVRQRDEAPGADSQPPAPSPAPEAPPSETQAQAEPQADASRQEGGEVHTAATDDLAPASDADQEPAPPPASQPADEEQANADEEQAPAAPSPQPAPASPAPNAPPLGGAVPPAPPQIQQPAPMPSPPQAPAPATAAAPPPKVRGHADIESARSASAASSAPADATAFAPKKLRRGTPELVRIVVHQPKDLNAVIKAARKIDPRTEPAPSGMKIGEVALGSAIGVSLEVRGANAEGTLQRRTWRGEPIDFSFSVEADTGVKQVVLLARVFIDDAQIGVLAFTRNVAGPSKKPAADGDRVRLRRHRRVFLSYSSRDRETVAAIATAYEAAGVPHFWDRASLKSGEEWSPRLRREIEKADLFHLCWSKSAATSEWVEKETEFALTRRKRNSGKPDITVQMLDGPPWAPHPPQLDAINFDDFVRAAVVGYARGDGST